MSPAPTSDATASAAPAPHTSLADSSTTTSVAEDAIIRPGEVPDHNGDAHDDDNEYTVQGELVEPFLLKIDIATSAFYNDLPSEKQKRLLVIAANQANVNPVKRTVHRRHFVKYRNGDIPGIDYMICDKYTQKQDRLLSRGTFDIYWGLSWLFSYIVLIDDPVYGDSDVKMFVDVVERWLKAVSEAVPEFAEQMDEEKMKGLFEKAKRELIACRLISNAMPGRFNSECSLVYGGELHSRYVKRNRPKWADDNFVHPDPSLLDDTVRDMLGFTFTEAKSNLAGIVKEGSACIDSCLCDIRVLDPDEDREFEAHGLTRVSKLDRNTMQNVGEPFGLRFSDEVINNLSTGMVFEGVLYTLSDGSKFIDSITMVWPSYSPLDYLVSKQD